MSTDGKSESGRASAGPAILGILVALILAGLLAFAGSQGGGTVAGVPAFAVCVFLAFLVQWIAFVPAFLRQTEHFFDLTGSITYIGLAGFGLWVGGDSRSLLLAVLVGLWAARLGTFLFTRVRSAGADRRFDRIKPDVWQFLMTWTLQGLWVSVTLSPALAAMTGDHHQPLGALAWVGAGIWLIGFLVETIADAQKRRFRAVPDNRERFITTGLWAWSRHPNYFGEIVLWCGIALICLPVLQGWQLVTLLSPLFVYVLLTRISGIRMLDNQARKRWGSDPDYEAYRRRTPRLVLWPPRSALGSDPA